MAARAPRPLLTALAILILLAGIVGASVAPDAAAQPQQRVRVYVLQGDEPASDQAVAQALGDRGFDVTRGVATHSFDGSQADLGGYDVLVALYTANWNQPVPPAGLQAIRAYVEGGGSLVTGEWFGWRGQLAELMPSVNCGWNTAASTTYTQVAANPLIGAGVPASFSFALSNFSGSETCLQARPEATVFYGSSNGGGRGGGVGLAAWNVGQGRVAAFSTLLGAAELASVAYRTLFQNTVGWAAQVRDATPPRVQSVELAGAGGMVRGREVELTVRATDSGGAGLGSVIVAEYVFSNDDDDAWRLASTSGWRLYRQPRATLSLTLGDEPGVHYLHVYAADRAGNISREPAVVFVNYQPPGPTPIGLDVAHLYRFALSRTPTAVARMRVEAGNPDLYVQGPGVQIAPVSDLPVEEISFAATAAGVYEVGVLGHQAGAYSLELEGDSRGRPAGDDDEYEILRRGRGSVINAVPYEPVGDSGDLPAPPAEDAGVGREPAVFLPAVQRQ